MFVGLEKVGECEIKKQVDDQEKIRKTEKNSLIRRGKATLVLLFYVSV